MEKSEYVRQAPLYYALAIAAQLSTRDTVSRKTIEGAFYITEEDNESRCLIDHAAVWKAAINWLVEMDMVVEMKGAFGPSLYKRSSSFSDRWAHLLENEAPFTYFNMVHEKDDWLLAALLDVDNGYYSLSMKPEDFDRLDQEWDPIQVDTSAPEIKQAIEKLSNAVEEIRKDNGYAAEVPEERAYVLEGLEGAVKKLESGTVSAGYIRDAWNRLAIVGRRFAGASLELVITGAKQAIVEFVKSQGGELLRSLLHLFH